jgi:hypothetical protein
MSERLEAARRELREALAVARTSLAQVRASQRTPEDPRRVTTQRDLEVRSDEA